MGQPRRRRRRRRRSRSQAAARTTQQTSESSTGRAAPEAATERRRARRPRKAAPPASSEEVVRSFAEERPRTVTSEHDGVMLEQVIGELQSKWGVPQSPQEYRITIKVAEEREDRGTRTATLQESLDDPPDDKTRDGAPRREKAPAAPRIESGARPSGGHETPSPRRKRRRRRGRRRRSGGGGSSPH